MTSSLEPEEGVGSVDSPGAVDDDGPGRGGSPQRRDGMTEGEADQPVTGAAADAGEQTVGRAGRSLRAAREEQGLTLAEIGQRTRVPLRHLEAVEVGDLAALPSPTYAVGFARAYARAVGLDDVAIARDIRADLGKIERPPEYVPYETADPDRVPSRGLAIVGLGMALAILILAGLYYGTDVLRPGAQVGGPAATSDAPIVAEQSVPPAPVAPRQVSLAAGEQEVWLRVYDADDATLYLGTLAPGAKFDVPPNANRPMINVGRPDQLRVTLDGRPVPPLGDGRRAIKDVPVDAEAIAARGTANPTAQSTTSSTTTPSTALPITTPTTAAVQPSSIAPARVAESRRQSPRAAASATPRARAATPRPTPSSDGPENLLPSGFRQNGG